MNYLLCNIKKITNRFCLLNTAFFLILCVCVYYAIPYFYNLFCGPFPVSWGELEETSLHLDRQESLPAVYLQRLYWQIDAEDIITISAMVEDRGYRSFSTSIDENFNLRHESSKSSNLVEAEYALLLQSDKMIWTNLPYYDAWKLKEELPLAGRLYVTGEGFGEIFQDAHVLTCAEGTDSKYQPGDMIQPEDILNIAFVADTGFVTYTSTLFVILLLLLLWCIANFVIILRRLIDPSAHPIFKRCSNPMEMLTEFGSGNVEVKGRVAETEHWVLERRFLRLRLSRKTPKKERDPYSRWGSLDDE